MFIYWLYIDVLSVKPDCEPRTWNTYTNILYCNTNYSVFPDVQLWTALCIETRYSVVSQNIPKRRQYTQNELLNIHLTSVGFYFDQRCGIKWTALKNGSILNAKELYIIRIFEKHTSDKTRYVIEEPSVRGYFWLNTNQWQRGMRIDIYIDLYWFVEYDVL